MPLAMYRAGTLTPSCSGPAASGSPLTAPAAASRTQRTRVPISPELSAIGTNSDGLISPSVGCRQRASASTPVTFCSPKEMTGWKSIDSSPREQAPTSSARSRSRRAAASPRVLR
jgi:hypothetical protein